ncbi:multidrug efflux SMR transporter [uncultured Alistipes sp.]|jgi:membrane transporters of cations and cationic drugs|uniref:DMT family transporter n=1 Tax=uncultured Alistipes sp. TaxID=538949 RepID=UPI0025F8812B|nr:multidrug efflux SMR transporter [uncultured Alistipes sp.]
MAWVLLIFAGLFEMGWPLGFKLADVYPKYHTLFLGVAVVSMAVSGWLLYIAQKSIPMGTAYVIWTGIGGIGTVVLGILFFHDAVTFWRMFFLVLILIGILGLKMVH